MSKREKTGSELRVAADLRWGRQPCQGPFRNLHIFSSKSILIIRFNTRFQYRGVDGSEIDSCFSKIFAIDEASAFRWPWLLGSADFVRQRDFFAGVTDFLKEIRLMFHVIKLRSSHKKNYNEKTALKKWTYSDVIKRAGGFAVLCLNLFRLF